MKKYYLILVVLMMVFAAGCDVKQKIYDQYVAPNLFSLFLMVIGAAAGFVFGNLRKLNDAYVKDPGWHTKVDIGIRWLEDNWQLVSPTVSKEVQDYLNKVKVSQMDIKALPQELRNQVNNVKREAVKASVMNYAPGLKEDEIDRVIAQRVVDIKPQPSVVRANKIL